MRTVALIAAVAATLIVWGCGDSAPAPVAAPDRTAPRPAATTPAEIPASQPTQPMGAQTMAPQFPALGSESAEVAEGTLDAAGVQFTIPEDWEDRPPASSMRMAEYALPGPGGPADAVVFCFGPGQGGTVEGNISRWAGQFLVPDHPSTSPPPDVSMIEKDSLTIHTVRVSGTYTPGMGPMMQQGEPQPDQALFGIIVEGGPQGSVFIKVTGPEDTIEAQAGNLEALAASARL